LNRSSKSERHGCKNETVDRINLILQNQDYREYLKRNEAAEVNRSFCLHGLSHFLDVARIAYIMNLEQDLGYPKDIIYAVGLLHDIGRWKQYMEGIPHAMASRELAEPVLTECGYHERERKLILDAVLNHSSSKEGNRSFSGRGEKWSFSGREGKEGFSSREGKSSLDGIIYKADKASRACFWCSAASECDWSEKKKNHEIKY